MNLLHCILLTEVVAIVPGSAAGKIARSAGGKMPRSAAGKMPVSVRIQNTDGIGSSYLQNWDLQMLVGTDSINKA